MKLIEYLNNFEIFDDECVKKAIEMFGQNEVINSFTRIDLCIDEKIMEKVTDYLYCNKLLSELSDIEKESQNYIRNVGNEVSKELDVTSFYLKEISKYPVLNCDEEKKYCQDLELGKKLTILRDYLIDGKKVAFIDLGKVFVSLYNNEYAPLILNYLKSYFCSKENGIYKYINYYLQMYDVLVKEIGHYPSINELKMYFSENDQYQLLIFEDSLDKITLLEEIKKYLKYSLAREKMINCNLRLVVSIAKKYANNIEIIDLINEGNLGLIEAVSRFDINLGYRFSTYAFYWIRQRVSRYLYNQSSSIKISENLKYQLTCFKKKIDKLEQEHKRKLSTLEISHYLKMPVSKVIDYLAFSYTSFSLDDIAFNDEGAITFGNLLCDESSDVEKLSFQNILKMDVENFLSNLTPREILVIKLRFGIDETANRVHTFQEISDILGITRERIRQIEKKALIKLKKLSKSPEYSHLKEY